MSHAVVIFKRRGLWHVECLCGWRFWGLTACALKRARADHYALAGLR